MRVSGPVLDSDDPIGLAEFYAALMGWKVVDTGGGEAKDMPKWHAWALVRPESGDGKFEIQGDENFQRPVWPSRPGEPGMQMHIDIAVGDLDAGVAWAIACGATVAEHQPRDGNKVMLDPSGHPFCLFPGQV